MHVQSVQNYCFLLSNMQIYDVLVAIVVVVAEAPYKGVYATTTTTATRTSQICIFDSEKQ